MLQVKSIQKTCFLFDEIFSSETWTVATFMDESYHIRNPQQIISQSQLFCTFEVEISGVNIGRMIFKSGGPKKQLQIVPLRCFSDAELHPCFFLNKKGKDKKREGDWLDCWLVTFRDVRLYDNICPKNGREFPMPLQWWARRRVRAGCFVGVGGRRGRRWEALGWLQRCPWTSKDPSPRPLLMKMESWIWVFFCFFTKLLDLEDVIYI